MADGSEEDKVYPKDTDSPFVPRKGNGLALNDDSDDDEDMDLGGGDDGASKSSDDANRKPPAQKKQKKQKTKSSATSRLDTVRNCVNKGRKVKAENHYGKVNQWAILQLVSDMGNPLQEVKGSINDRDVGQNTYEMYLKHKPHHSYCILDLLDIVDDGVDERDYDCTGLTNHDPADYTPQWLADKSPILTIDEDEKTFTASCIQVVIGLNMLYKFEHYIDYQKSTRTSTPTPFHPKLFFMKQSSLHKAMCARHEQTLRFLWMNFDAIVLGHNEYFKTKPAPEFSIVKRQQQSRTFWDFTLEQFSFELRVKRNVTFLPPLSLVTMADDKYEMGQVFANEKIPTYTTLIPEPVTESESRRLMENCSAESTGSISSPCAMSVISVLRLRPRLLLLIRRLLVSYSANNTT